MGVRCAQYPDLVPTRDLGAKSKGLDGGAKYETVAVRYLCQVFAIAASYDGRHGDTKRTEVRQDLSVARQDTFVAQLQTAEPVAGMHINTGVVEYEINFG